MASMSIQAATIRIKITKDPLSSDVEMDSRRLPDVVNMLSQKMILYTINTNWTMIIELYNSTPDLNR